MWHSSFNRDLKQTDVAAERRRSTGEFIQLKKDLCKGLNE